MDDFFFLLLLSLNDNEVTKYVIYGSGFTTSITLIQFDAMMFLIENNDVNHA